MSSIKSTNSLGIKLGINAQLKFQFKYLTESTKQLFQSKKKQKRRPDGLPREWDRNHHYIGDSWAVHGHRLKNIKDREFWSLKVLERDRTKSSRAYSYWMCECSCGRRYSIRSDRLRKGEKFCCIVCKRKIDQVYKRLEMEKLRMKLGLEYFSGISNSSNTDSNNTNTNTNTNRKKKVKRIKVTQSLYPTGSYVHVKGRLYSKGNILEMRDHYQMSIEDIATQLSLTKDEVRAEISNQRKSGNQVSSPSNPTKVKLPTKSDHGSVYGQGKPAFQIRNSQGMSPAEVRKYIENQRSANQKQSS